ncbi:hypothetical protein AAG906_008056 [Vitis piasezkii]
MVPMSFDQTTTFWCSCTFGVTSENSWDTLLRCQECQMHGDLIHVPPSELHALASPWPFSVWGIDIIGKISPKSSNGHEYILVAIDYFTKWVEAASYARLTVARVAKFIRSHIISTSYSLVYGMEATALGSLSTSPFPSYRLSHLAHMVLRYLTLRTQGFGIIYWEIWAFVSHLVAATFGALSEVQMMHAIYHFKAQEVNNPMLQTCCEITLLLRSDFAAFLYSRVYLLLKLPDIYREKEAWNLKVEANFAALRV